MKESGEIGFGDELKRERLIREVSLEKIAEATKISKRYLEALEQGRFEALPAPVFTRGFIRAYAQFLGLNPEEMINAYLAESQAGPGETSRAGESMASVRPVRRSSWAVGGVVALLAVLLIGGLTRARRNLRREPAARATSASAPTAPNIRPVPAGASAGDTPPAAVAQQPQEARPEAASPGAARPVVLALEFQADCWLELFADERLVYSGLLRSGDTRQFSAQKNFRMTLGDAAAARVTVNGRLLPALGGRGEVVRDYRIDGTAPSDRILPRG